MKLNQKQRYALLAFLCENFKNFFDMHIAYDFDRFCDGDITEWRVIGKYGMAGKLWNNSDRIYLSGYSPCEIGGRESKSWKEHSAEVDELNEKLTIAIGIYDSAFDKIKKVLT